MKSSNQIKALTLSFVAGFAITACGGSGDSGGTGNENLAPVQLNTVNWSKPTQNQTNVCRRAMFEVRIDDGNSCSWSNIASAFRLFPLSAGPDAPLEITSAFVQQITAGKPEDGCKFMFKPKKALAPTTSYGLAVWSTDAGGGALYRDSVTFTSGDLLGSTCTGNEQFMPTNINLPRQMIATNADRLGVVENDLTIDFNWSQFSGNVATAALQTFFDGILGINLISPTHSFLVRFNDAVDADAIASSIRIYEMGTPSQNYALLNPIGGVTAQVEGAQGTDIRLNVSGGLMPNKSYVLVVARSLRSNAHVYLKDSFFVSFKTVT